jgi:hypothetical protein
VLGNARNDLAEEVGVGGQILLALDFTAQMERAELRQRILQRRTTHIHLVQRLHGGQTSRAALVGGSVGLRIAFGGVGHECFHLCCVAEGRDASKDNATP